MSPALLAGDRFSGALTRKPGEVAGIYEITKGPTTTPGTDGQAGNQAGESYAALPGAGNEDLLRWRFVGGAIASSGEKITYTSSNAAVAEVTENGLIRITGAGETTITAAVPENSNYANQPEISPMLTVKKARQTIAFNVPAEVNHNARSIPLDVATSSGLAVSLGIDDEQVATLEGELAAGFLNHKTLSHLCSDNWPIR